MELADQARLLMVLAYLGCCSVCGVLLLPAFPMYRGFHGAGMMSAIDRMMVVSLWMVSTVILVICWRAIE